MEQNEDVENIKVHGYIIDDIKEIVKNFLLEQDGIPIVYQLTIGALYIKPEAETAAPILRDYHTKQIRIQLLDQEDVESDILQLEDRMTEENFEGSGLILKQITFVQIKIHPYRSRLGGTYVKLPISNHEILNIDNTGYDLCFIWSVLAYFHHADDPDHPNRVSNYRPYINELNLNGMTGETSIEDVERFNEQNPSIPVNVFDLKPSANKKKIPDTDSKNQKTPQHIRL